MRPWLRNWKTASLGLLVLLAAPRANADTITIVFSGAISELGRGLISVGNPLPIGTPFSGSLVFSDAAPDFDASPAVSIFDVPAGVLNVQLGGFSFASDDRGLELSIVDADPGDDGSDAFAANSFTRPTPALGGLTAAGAGFFLFNEQANVLVSDALADFPFDLSRFSGLAQFGFTPSELPPGLDPEDFLLSGTIDRLTVTVMVPEPGATGLLALALGALALRRRRLSSPSA